MTSADRPAAQRARRAEFSLGAYVADAMQHLRKKLPPNVFDAVRETLWAQFDIDPVLSELVRRVNGPRDPSFLRATVQQINGMPSAVGKIQNVHRGKCCQKGR